MMKRIREVTTLKVNTSAGGQQELHYVLRKLREQQAIAIATGGGGVIMNILLATRVLPARYFIWSLMYGLDGVLTILMLLVDYRYILRSSKPVETTSKQVQTTDPPI